MAKLAVKRELSRNSWWVNDREHKIFNSIIIQ